METLHTTHFDVQLSDALPHLSKYPQYLPFLGKDWDVQKDKLLLVAESHFLPEGCDNRSDSETWYEGIKLYPDELKHTNTRLVVSRHNNQPLEIKRNHPYFINVEQIIRKTHSIPVTYNFLQSIGYCNYFQRPAETTGGSIINKGIDNDIAYSNLKFLTTFAGVTHIVFTSKKAFIEFNKSKFTDIENPFSSVKIDCVPHPTSIWWNRKSKSYGDEKTKSSGKEKFERIIKGIRLNTTGSKQEA